MPSITELPMVQRAVRKLRRHGLGNLLLQLGLRLLRSTVQLRILRGLHIEQVDPAFLDCDARFTSAFQAPRALRCFAAEPANEISFRFVRDAVAGGDACYAVCEGHKLVSSGWYATRPTSIGAPELVLRFDPCYVYMYKGRTAEQYRGQRLYEVGVTRALQHYLGKGAKGFISYADASNLDSLKASLRMGYRIFGSVYLVSLFGRHFTFASPGCRAFDFRLEIVGAGAARLVPGKA
jgi:hypothetical protein